MSIYAIELETIRGETLTMDKYKDKVLLIVNTASKCGFSNQFASLEKLYKQYQDQGFVVLGFPCNQFLNQEPGTPKDIMEYCNLHYGVTFPMFKKTLVKGKDKHPLYRYLIENTPVRTNKNIKWNFEKFLVSRDGTVLNRYSSRLDPLKFEDAIVDALKGEMV